MRLKIDGEVFEVDNVTHHGPAMIESGRVEYYVFETAQDAGEEARKYWEELAQDDPKEFTCMVGEETLIQWGLGQSAGPGSTHVTSLNDWLDLWLDTPEEHFGSYDSTECETSECDKELTEELGFTPAVAYRHN